ncbi:MAG TPA: aminotransferase class I/II-fold pyridoxal phosphate-dependent enzyme, partial [Blastocatellia bacterium]|nr:aminotransferase class I/II-fold pyridoxal phosphate-dependent enzyme [Blastocatellia bacterium]
LISSMYEKATIENVVVTNGGAEANLVSTWMLTEPGDEAVIMLPNYMQIWGLARGYGAEVKPFHLLEKLNWAPDIEELERAISKKTKFIAVCNPNNPTGAVLSESEMDRIVECARRAGNGGAWLIADEIYRGAERIGGPTPSFWGRYHRLIITSGLSKAYGLPGLRIGWIVSSPEMVAKAWSYRDYTTICPSATSDLLARVALRPDTRERLLARTRQIIQTNFPVLDRWVGHHDAMMTMVPPRAGAIAYIKYQYDIDSLDLIVALRDKKSLLAVPGAHFDMGRYMRIGFGANLDQLKEGLSLIDNYLSEL